MTSLMTSLICHSSFLSDSFTDTDLLFFAWIPLDVQSETRSESSLLSLFLLECNTILDKDTVIYMQDPCVESSLFIHLFFLLVHASFLIMCLMPVSFLFFHYSSCPLPFYSSSLNHTLHLYHLLSSHPST